ncbi:hypothetical protein EAF00_000269 [Botryotinia globosa]|nr:hypothetical protein EAF00_000269 [Botryotinia globosa]
MHMLPLLYIFLPFLVFTSATALSTSESENLLQTTTPTQPIQTIAQSTTPNTNPASSPSSQTPIPSTPLSSGTYLPPTRLTSQTKSTLSPNSTASLILIHTPTSSSSNAFESEWNKVTNWLSGSGASSLHPGSPYWGAWMIIGVGVGVAWGGW